MARGSRGNVRIQAGTGGGQQVGGNVLPLDVRILFQKIRDGRLHPGGKVGIGRRVVVGAGANAGESRSVGIGFFAVRPLHIDVVMIGGGAAPQIIVLQKFLPHVFGGHGPAVHLNQAAAGLVRKEQGGQAGQQSRKQQAANQHENERNRQGLPGMA